MKNSMHDTVKNIPEMHKRNLKKYNCHEKKETPQQNVSAAVNKMLVRTSAKNPYCPSILVLTISISCTLLFDVIAVTRVAVLSLSRKGGEERVVGREGKEGEKMRGVDRGGEGREEEGRRVSGSELWCIYMLWSAG